MYNKLTSFFSLVIGLNLILIGFFNPANAEQKAKKARVSDFGLPTHRRDGGSRGNQDSCLANAENQNLMALIPEETVGVNASNSPKLFFYVPKIKQTSTLEFVLRDEQDQLIYETFVATEGNGIVGIEVPANLHDNMLSANQNYHWYLSMICDQQQRSHDIVVEGWMRQETVDLATQVDLNSASSLEKAEIYREQGFWFDALSVLTEDSDSVAEKSMMQQQWSEMLSSVGLENLISEPFVETTIIKNLANPL